MKWGTSELEYLKKVYNSPIKLSEICANLQRSKISIKHKAARLNLSRPRVPINKPKDVNHRNKADKKYYELHRTEIYKNKIKRLREYKVELIKELGGECAKCGYSKCPSALEFHHQSGNKENEVAFLIKNSSKGKALKEAKRCMLVCANCHRELHFKGP